MFVYLWVEIKPIMKSTRIGCCSQFMKKPVANINGCRGDGRAELPHWKSVRNTGWGEIQEQWAQYVKHKTICPKHQMRLNTRAISTICAKHNWKHTILHRAQHLDVIEQHYNWHYSGYKFHNNLLYVSITTFNIMLIMIVMIFMIIMIIMSDIRPAMMISHSIYLTIFEKIDNFWQIAKWICLKLQNVLASNCKMYLSPIATCNCVNYEIYIFVIAKCCIWYQTCHGDLPLYLSLAEMPPCWSPRLT